MDREGYEWDNIADSRTEFPKKFLKGFYFEKVKNYPISLILTSLAARGRK